MPAQSRTEPLARAVAVAHHNMEDALARRERLKALKQAAALAGGDGDAPSTTAPAAAAAEPEKPVLKFRNYTVKDASIAHETVRVGGACATAMTADGGGGGARWRPSSLGDLASASAHPLQHRIHTLHVIAHACRHRKCAQAVTHCVLTLTKTHEQTSLLHGAAGRAGQAGQAGRAGGGGQAGGRRPRGAVAASRAHSVLRRRRRQVAQRA